MSDDSDYLPEQPSESSKPRKRKLNRDNWKKTQEKVRKRLLKDNGFQVICNHRSENSFCKADKLTDEEVKNFHDKYWSLMDAVKERMFIQRYIQVSTISRHRVQENAQQRRRSWSTSYNVPTESGIVSVCKETFMSILSVNRRKVEKAAHDILQPDEEMTETRGGARISELKSDMNDKIAGHIKSFKCREKHYGRGNAPGRAYLANHLNVKKMWELFCATDEGKDCKYSTYYRIFMTKFNLGFGTSKSDVCSECIKLKHELKSNTKSDAEKNSIYTDLRLHKYRAKKFYEELKTFPDGTLTINFDLMQNQPLPKTPIGEAFYARQIWYYIFAVVIHNERGSLNKDNVHFYRWVESEYGRGSNEILSCLSHFLHQVIVHHLNGINKLRFFSDSCSGQNKNYAAIVMLHKFCLSRNIEYEWFFPIRGHSYMPADRAFGILEKKLRKIDTILVPSEYDAVVSSVGTLHCAGSTVIVQDWQTAAGNIIRTKKDFKITDAKVIGLDLGHKTKVGFKPVYSVSFNYFYLLKKNTKFESVKLNLHQQRKASRITQAKAVDVKNLLSAMGQEWESIDFYKKALENPSEDEVEDQGIVVVNEDLL